MPYVCCYIYIPIIKFTSSEVHWERVTIRTINKIINILFCEHGLSQHLILSFLFHLKQEHCSFSLACEMPTSSPVLGATISKIRIKHKDCNSAKFNLITKMTKIYVSGLDKGVTDAPCKNGAKVYPWDFFSFSTVFWGLVWPKVTNWGAWTYKRGGMGMTTHLKS